MLVSNLPTAPKDITSLWIYMDWVIHVYGNTRAKEPGGRKAPYWTSWRMFPSPPSHPHIMSHGSTSLSQGSKRCRCTTLCSSPHLPASVILLKPCCRAFCLWLPRELPLPLKMGSLRRRWKWKHDQRLHYFSQLIYMGLAGWMMQTCSSYAFRLSLSTLPWGPSIPFHPTSLVSYL